MSGGCKRDSLPDVPPGLHPLGEDAQQTGRAPTLLVTLYDLRQVPNLSGFYLPMYNQVSDALKGAWEEAIPGARKESGMDC